MKFKWTMRAVLCGAAVSLLSGCLNPVQVKDVQQDKTGFLTSHFSPGNLPAGVLKTISSADGSQVNFKRVVYQLDWDNNTEDKSKEFKTNETNTVTNVGNGLVQFIMENSRNGVPVSQTYGISYRNFLTTKVQSMNLGANVAPMEMQIKSFEHFDPVSSLKTGLKYTYKWGTTVQFMNFHDGSVSCVSDGAQPASELNKTLSGESWKMTCQFFNQNGVLGSKWTYAYLEKYGIAVAARVESPTGINEAKIVSFTVE